MTHTMSFRLHAIRHPQPDIETGICYGEMDMPPVMSHLDEVATFIQRELPVDQLINYTSPLQRAKLLSEAVGAQAIVEPALAEMSFGDWEGTAWDKLPKSDVLAWRSDFMGYTISNGESVAGFYQRVNHFIEQLLPLQQDTALFAHAGIIRCLLHKTNDVPLSQGEHFDLAYGSITTFIWDNNQLKLERVNHAP